MPDGVQIPGIEIYHAVFVGGVRNYEELEHWRKNQSADKQLGLVAVMENMFKVALRIAINEYFYIVLYAINIENEKD